ncbi:MAG: hypothetical protein LCH67_05900 [Bacteroidetes bacterium]|nr:hypothetical protein [Bacteroidota bacterium]
MLGDGQPAGLGYFAGFVEVHFTIYDFPEQMCSVLTAQCDKVQSFTAIVVAFEPNAAAVVFFGIVAVHVLLISNCYRWNLRLRIYATCIIFLKNGI